MLLHAQFLLVDGRFCLKTFLQWLELSGEVSQYGRLVCDAHPPDMIPFFKNSFNALDHIIDVAFGINPSGNRQSHHFQFGRFKFTALGVGFTEHHTADFAAADATTKIELAGQRLARVLMLGDMRQKCFCIDINGVSARRLENRGTDCRYMFAQISNGSNSIFKIVFF